jgi:hypothetical protein
MNDICKDERTIAIENASYRVAFCVLAIGALFDAVYRSWVLHQHPFDLLGLVMGTYIVAGILQARQRILGKCWGKTVLIAMGVGAVVAVVVTLLIILTHRH